MTHSSGHLNRTTNMPGLLELSTLYNYIPKLTVQRHLLENNE